MVTLLNLGWALVVLLSFASLGRILARIMVPDDRPDLGLATGWGLAGMTILGGLLNLLGISRSSILIALVFALIVVNLLFERLRGQQRSVNGIEQGHPSPGPLDSPGNPLERWDRIWIAAMVALVAVRFVSSLAINANVADDRPAYLFQVSRLLQTGWLGTNPFSDRQILSLNGQSFLLALLCSVSPPKYAYSYLLDPGICWIMIAGLTWGLIRRDLGGSPKAASVVTALILMIQLPYDLNLGGQLTGTVLGLTLVRTAERGLRGRTDLDRGSLLLLALTVAGMCALKMTFFIFAVLFVAAWYGMRLRHSRGLRVMIEPFAIAFVVILLLLPWMYQQYVSGGTFLYPFLGTGNYLQGAAVDPFTNPLSSKVKTVISYLLGGLAAPAILCMLLLSKNPFEGDADRWRVLLAFLAASIIASVVVPFQIGSLIAPVNIRYTQPILYSALLACGVTGFFRAKSSQRAMGAALCLAFFVGGQWANLYRDLLNVKGFLAGREGLLSDPIDAGPLLKAQASVPAGELILASTEYAFFFDFRRNPIWNLDHPGTTSPPPGLPLPADPSAIRDFLRGRITDLPTTYTSEELREYLQRLGIRHLIFQKRTLPTSRRWFPDRDPLEGPTWSRLVGLLGKLYYGQFFDLMRKTRVLYDDGDYVVLDLSRGDSTRPTKHN